VGKYLRLPTLFNPGSDFWRHYPPCGQEKTSRHVEVAQGEEHVHDINVFGKSFVAYLGESEDAFDDVEDIFNSRTDF
jgi:hypothetical protein